MSTYSTLSKANRIELNNLVWKQPKFSRDHYELCGKQKLFADLSFTQMFSDRAEAHSAHGSWILNRPGFFRDQVFAWSRESGDENARAVRRLFGDYELSILNYTGYQFFCTKILANTWVLTGENDKILYEIQFDLRWFKQYNQIWLTNETISSFKNNPDQIDLLLILGMYLRICSTQDAAGAVAATSAAIF